MGIDRSVQNCVSSGEYGIYYALLNFSYMFNIILDFGITNFNNKTIAQNTVLLKKYFERILPLKLILAGVFVVALFVVAFFTGYKGRMLHLLFWLAVFQILTYFLTYFRSNISAFLLFKTDSVLSVLDKALTILFCSVLLWTSFLKKRFCVEYFVYAQVLAMFISCVTAFSICLLKTGKIGLKWNFTFMIAILKYGFPFALLSLLMACYNRIDGVFLERILRDNGVAAGIYASGFRIVDSANMVSYLFSVILLPLFAKLIKDRADIKGIVHISSHLLLFAGMCFVCVSFLYSRELMELLYNKNIEQSAQVYRILCFCFLPISFTYIFGTLLTANGSLAKLNIVAASGMILNITLNLILVPLYRQNGSAVSSLSSQLLTAILQILIALKIFHIRFELKYFFKLTFYILTLIVSAIAISRIGTMGWPYKVGLTVVLFGVLSFVFKIFDVKDIALFVSTGVNSRKKDDKQRL